MPESESEGLLSQDDINAALAAAGLSGQGGETADVASTEPASDAAATAQVAPPPAAHAVSAQPYSLPELKNGAGDATATQGIDLLRDVELNVKIELGRSRMLVEEVLRLGEGSVVELDKLAGDPVDVFVNNRLVAHGEVLVLNDNFCVRISEIVARNGENGWT